MATDLDQAYWNSRYINNETGWDIGRISTPIKYYLDQVSNRSKKILIPGAGNAYEAEYAYDSGFVNTHVVDISDQAIQRFSERVSAFPTEQLHWQDFFQHTGQYDLIIEQTFFCALNPSLRTSYARHMSSLLRPDGRLVGVLFDRDFGYDHPPFGGDAALYEAIFSPYLDIETMEPCHNSIKPRQGSELWIDMRPK